MEHFQRQVLAALDILQKITQAKLPPFEKTTFERKADQLINAVATHGVLSFVLMVVLAGLTYAFQTTPLLNTTLTIGAITGFLGWSILVALVVAMTPSLWQIGKNPYGQIFRLIRRAAMHDLSFLKLLENFDPLVLRFSLMQYKAERTAFEKRSSLLSGSLEKIGFFPALGALLALSITLSKAAYLGHWANSLIFLLFAFYILNGAAFLMQQKMDAVIALVEFAITFAEDKIKQEA